MLNTVMALWNQNPGENRQRVVKLLFTFLFISVSIFLLLFTLNSSAWTSVTGKEQIQTKKRGQVGASNHSGMATAGNTPASYGVVAGITPAATRTSIQACVHTPTVVVPPSVVPQKVVIYARNRDLKHKSSKPRQVRPMTVHVGKDKPRSRKRPPVKVIATPVPQETIVVMLPPSPVPTIQQPTVTPIVIATVTETPVPTEGTVVSGMPDIVSINTTPDTSMTSTNSFAYNLRQKGTVHISVSPTAKSTKKSSGKQSQRVYENVECSRSTTYKDNSVGTVLKAKRRIGLLLGGSLLGTALFCFFVFARRREK
jgi:hypothetical protein